MSEWRDIETAKESGAVVLGWQDGCVFAMVWHPPLWFESFGPMCAQRETGGWVVQGIGFVCYTGAGLLQIVKPTKWQPLPEPPE